MPQIQLKDHEKDDRLVRRRVLAGAVFVLLLSVALVARMYFLQVVQYQQHVTLSENNRVHVQPIPPTRGLIFDRNGVIIADNRPSFSLTVTRERAKDWPAILDTLSEVLELTDEERALYDKRMKQGRRPFEPVPIQFELSEEQIARISVNQFRLPGVEISARLVRHYPQGASYAHSVGYVDGSTSRNCKSSTRSTTAVPTISARPVSSASMKPICTARWVTRKSKPTPAAACCGCSSAPTRSMARTCT
jgi:penicillin-binding protein 2